MQAPESPQSREDMRQMTTTTLRRKFRNAPYGGLFLRIISR